jgi:DNA modification methylase
MTNQLFYGDNLEVLRKYIADESVDLCYFNSYPVPAQSPKKDWNEHDEALFLEIITSTQNICPPATVQWIINFEKSLGKTPALAFLIKSALCLAESFRTLKKTGSCYVHCKADFAPYLRLLADSIFTSQKGIFRNEIVLCLSKPSRKSRYGYKNIPWKKRYWQPLHETLLFYTKSRQYYFEMPHDETSYWQFHYSIEEQEFSHVGYNSSSLMYRVIRCSSKQNEVVLDLFGKAGTTAIEAKSLNRNWILIESNKMLYDLITLRLLDRQIQYQTL